MRTTLNIEDAVMKQIEQEAARQRRTVSELVETALRALLQKPPRLTQSLPPLPELDSGGTKVDVANRNALYDVMER